MVTAFIVTNDITIPKINHEPDNQHQMHMQLDLSNQNRPFYIWI